MLITAKTSNQKKYLKAIHNNDIIICEGQSGSGKTMCAIGAALELMMGDNTGIDKIYFTRPMISCSDFGDFPTVPGNVDEKFGVYTIHAINLLNKIIGKKETKLLIESKKIEFIPIELCRGYTFENCVVIIDEAQNLTPSQTVLMITRLGADNCKAVFTCDLNQKDLGKKYFSAADLLIDSLKNTNLIKYIKMLPEDNQRNPKIIEILEYLDWKS